MPTLLGNKKAQKNDQNWCIILNPIKSELEKKQVSQRISAVFSLTPEEAADLVTNTPIILLDHLNRDLAAQIKNYFRSCGAEWILTNDVFLKRKCYRTVWPSLPDLSFLKSISEPGTETESLKPAVREDEKAENPDEMQALKDLAAQVENVSGSRIPEGEAGEPGKSHEEELNRWKTECLDLREQTSRLQTKLDEVRKRPQEGAVSEAEVRRVMREKDEIVQQMRDQLAEADENLHRLSQEVRQSQAETGEKLQATESLCQKLQDTVADLQTVLKVREAETGELREALEKQEGERRQIESEFAEERDRFREGTQHLEETIHRLEAELAQAVQTADAERGIFQQEKNEWERMREEADRELEESAQMRQEWEMRMQDELTRREDTELQKKDLRAAVDQKEEQIQMWRKRCESLEQDVESLKRDAAAERSDHELLVNRYNELKESQSKMLQELENRSEEALQWEWRSREAERKFEDLQTGFAEKQQGVQELNQRLESRERELELARRQLRDMNGQVEQREVLQRKSFLSSQLSEKERVLKKMMEQQERVMAEIRDREGVMKEILAEQENLEKEIIECRQAYRHFIEQSKRDKTASRIRITRGTAMPEAPPEETPKAGSDDRASTEQNQD